MPKKTVFIFSTIFLLFLTGGEKASAARLYIRPPTGNYEIGAQFQAEIILDTEGESTAGTDVYLNFDPTVLNAVTIQDGTAYSTYLGKNIDNKNGSISVSGITSLDATDGYTGTDTFATILFKGAGKGTSQVTFDFSPGDKNDSNVAVLATSDDGLTSATGATYTIGAGAGSGSKGGIGSGGSAGGSGAGSAKTTPSELPKSGSLGDTLKLAGAGLGALLVSFLLLL